MLRKSKEKILDEKEKKKEKNYEKTKRHRENS
jgi:hypothetical protein